LEDTFWMLANEEKQNANRFSLELHAVYMMLHFGSEFLLNEEEPPSTEAIRLNKLIDLYLFSMDPKTNWNYFIQLVSRFENYKLFQDILVLYRFIFAETISSKLLSALDHHLAKDTGSVRIYSNRSLCKVQEKYVMSLLLTNVRYVDSQALVVIE